MTCIQCGNKNGKRKALPMPIPGYTIRIEHAYWRDIRAELPDDDHDNESCIDYEQLSQEKPIESRFDLPVLTHTVKQQYKNETLPAGEELFEDSIKLKFKILDKKLTIDAGDFLNCPEEYYPKI
jgi:hypothetical protein